MIKLKDPYIGRLKGDTFIEGTDPNPKTHHYQIIDIRRDFVRQHGKWDWFQGKTEDGREYRASLMWNDLMQSHGWGSTWLILDGLGIYILYLDSWGGLQFLGKLRYDCPLFDAAVKKFNANAEAMKEDDHRIEMEINKIRYSEWT